MKLRLSICVLIILVSTSIIIVNETSGDAPAPPPYYGTCIKVAIDNSKDFMGQPWLVLPSNFVNALNYSWTVDSDRYYFYVDVSNMSVLENYDKLEKYDVLVVAGVQDEQFWLGLREPFQYGVELVRHFTDGKREPFVAYIQHIKENLEKFVHAGHGYVGHCGGGALPLLLNHTPQTLYEGQVNRGGFLIPLFCNSTTNVYAGYPLVDEHFSAAALKNYRSSFRGMPELIAQCGLMWYTGNKPDHKNESFAGSVVDLKITDNNHPILKDFIGDTLRVRYGAGPSITVPPGNNNVSRLMYFPKDAYDTQSAIAWRFPLLTNNYLLNPARLFVNAVLDEDPKALEEYISSRTSSLFTGENGLRAFYNMSDWKQHLTIGRDTDIHYIDPKINNQIAMVAFNYPEGDEDGGRVFISGCQHELFYWDINGNYIRNVDDTCVNNLYEGLIHWWNDSGTPDNPNDDRLLDESDKIYNTNDWFIRREVAWAAGSRITIPDNSLPPVYGRSQVVDINPLLQEKPEFIIKCCVGKFNYEQWNTTNLSLFYRYIGENSSYNWTNWTYYDSINSTPYRFTFNTSTTFGDGIYEFCSILNTSTCYQNGQAWYMTFDNESFPPGADAWCGVGQSILSRFTYEPTTPYVNETVHFTSEALTKSGTHISWYVWDFDDPPGTGGSDRKNVTHTYTHSGVYTVNLTVTNNQSQTDTALVNITVLNNPPNADFNISTNLIHINKQVNFTDTSSDPDGYITNWTWDFGDGNTSHNQHPNHTYTDSGRYTVSLQATDNENANDTETKPGCILVINAEVNKSLSIDHPEQYQWKTIQRAINNATTGDIIYIHSTPFGYPENIVINKSLLLIGENKTQTLIEGSVTMTNPHDYELSPPAEEGLININGTQLLMHFNNDTTVGENYATSNTIYDYSGQGHNGTNHGANWTTRTLKGKGCFDFDGIDDSINLTTIPALTDTNVTISAWIYWDESTGNTKPICAQINNLQKGYCLAMNGTTDTPYFQLNETKAISASTIDTGWHHLVGTHNETTLAIYIDGTLTGTTSADGCGIQTTGFIGYDNNSHYFQGRIDEITIWNRTLTEDEIATLYNENYGVYIENLAICDATDIAIRPCNHTEINNCFLSDNPTGILLQNLTDVRIALCDIINGNIGININQSTPDEYNRIRLVDNNISVTNAVYVNASENITIIRNLITGINTNLTFNQGSNFDTMNIQSSTSIHNVAPDTPSLTGPTLGDPGKTYNYTTCTNDSNDDQLLYFFDWDDDNDTGWLNLYWSNNPVNASHAWANEGGYYVRSKAKDVFNNQSNWSTPILFKTETLPPLINTVNNTPDICGFGENITIIANVTDDMSSNYSGINTVTINITLPSHAYENHTMTSNGNNTYQYVFDNTWQVGRYNYTIRATDNAYNTNTSTDFYFNVSANATIHVCTLKDSYGPDEYINLTDPPINPDPYLYDRGLTWDRYYNPTDNTYNVVLSETPVNYQADNLSWAPINCNLESLTPGTLLHTAGYSIGNQRGLYSLYIKTSLQDTWPIAFAYDKSTQPNEGMIRMRPLSIGYLDPSQHNNYQALQNIQETTTTMTDDQITYHQAYTGTDLTLRYTPTSMKEELILNTQAREVFTSHPPSLYGLSDSESLLVFQTQVNLSGLHVFADEVEQTGDFTLDHGTIILKDDHGVVKCGFPVGVAYEQTQPDNNVIQLTYRFIARNNQYYLLCGLPLTEILHMSFPVVIDPTITKYASTDDGHIYKADPNYNMAHDAGSGTISASGTYFNVGQKCQFGIPMVQYVYRGFVHFNTSIIPDNATITATNLTLYGYADYSDTDFDVIVQNGQPTYPHMPLQSSDYSYVRYSGDGGSVNTSGFSVGGGNVFTFNLTGRTWINTTGYTKLCLRSNRDINSLAPPDDSKEYVSFYSSTGGKTMMPKLIVSYAERNQSKINNTGETNISGYLQMKVQYYHTASHKWYTANLTVNESTPRMILTGEQLGLDTIFNGKVNTTDLYDEFGDVLYRVYAEFRDPDGHILVCDDETELVATWEFIINS